MPSCPSQYSAEPASIAYYQDESTPVAEGEEPEFYVEVLDEILEHVEDETDLDGIAAVCQEELGTHIAYGAVRGFRGKFKRRGPPKGASKGKTKSKFSKGKSFSKCKAKPSLEERKRRLAEIKRRTRCQDCGEMGH